MRKNILLCLFLVWGLMALTLPPGAAWGFTSARSTVAESETGRYIVVLKDAPLAMYDGSRSGFAATSPQITGAPKLNVNNAASRSYQRYLTQKQEPVLTAMRSALRRAPQVDHRYSVVLNGFAVQLSQDEANKVAALSDVAFVQPERVGHPQTDAGPEWIGADSVWTGVPGYTAARGEGIIVGIIDTGINPLNDSFLNPGPVDGYSYTNPLGRYVGVCDSNNADYDATFPCNDKLIGAWDFTPHVTGNPVGPLDVVGHGSHTASTTAGNQVNVEIISGSGTLARTISGVAPHANIIVYRGCELGGCFSSATIAATEQAVTDGVDVINYSIGGSSRDPWSDAQAMAFLAVRNAGVFVAVSAGNSGPSAETMGSPANAPWVTGVGSSTHNRAFLNTLSDLSSDDASLPDIDGQGFTTGLGPTPIVDAGDYPNPNAPDDELLGACCTPYPAGTFDGQIVVCERGVCGRAAKADDVAVGGAGGFVLTNDEASDAFLMADAFALPGVAVTYQDGVDLKAWLAANTHTVAAISGNFIDMNNAWGDVVSSFSSRGPDATWPDVIKPDVTAPGTNILAADGTNGEIHWGLMSGTSMASPHVAGCAVLIKQLHANWTPAQIQSALMMTAHTDMRKEDGTTPADAFDRGAGRVQVNTALLAGLIMNETYGHYLAADPNEDGDPSALNIPSLAYDKTVFSHSWTRTVENATDQAVTWTVTTTGGDQLNLAASPNPFTLDPGQTQEIRVTAQPGGAAVIGEWLFGRVDFTAGGQSALHWPVTVRPVASNLASEYSFSDVYRQATLTIENIQASTQITDFTAAVFGMTPANEYSVEIWQDPTPGTVDDSQTPAMGEFVVAVTVAGENARLVAQIYATTSPDLDLYVYDATHDKMVCTSASSGSAEYCNIDDPEAATYLIRVQNFEATDPTGELADTFNLGVTVVPDAESGNAGISISQTDPMVAGSPFDINLTLDQMTTSRHWYGGFVAGTDADHPDNIGRANINIAYNNPTGTGGGGSGCFIRTFR
jgi:subtilisin family serine protease